jgi:hypothetical protein
VPAETVEEFARQYQADVFETSAKTDDNITEVFNKVARDYLRKKQGGGSGSGSGNANNLLHAPPSSSKSCEC